MILTVRGLKIPHSEARGTYRGDYIKLIRELANSKRLLEKFYNCSIILNLSKYSRQKLINFYRNPKKYSLIRIISCSTQIIVIPSVVHLRLFCDTCTAHALHEPQVRPLESQRFLPVHPAEHNSLPVLVVLPLVNLHTVVTRRREVLV